MSHLIAIAFWILAIWLIRRDTARRSGISSALWIPTLWAFILLSRPVSQWIGFGGGDDSLEGSPADRMFYFVLILLSFVTVMRRGPNWALLISKNWPILLFYGYFLISVLWADSPLVSFKRWFKDFGNLFVALVILTERNPLQAIRAVFVRCAYILLPLSVIFVRYFPELGRRYSRSGGLEITGVTTQKNSLGVLVLVCGFILLWDWLERTRDDRVRLHRLERYLPFGAFLIGIYLLYLCNSATSIICLILGASILLSVKLPFLRKRIGSLFLAGSLCFFVLDSLFGIRGAGLEAMGRDESLTGRTEVWRELLKLETDPLFGTGFCSFWSDQFYQSKLPYWVSKSAHNGYLEVYIDGGFVGLFFLGVMLLGVGWNIKEQLARQGNYALVRFASLVVILIGSYSESHFGRLGPLWFLFLLTALEMPRRRPATVGTKSPDALPQEASANPARQQVLSPCLA